MTHTHTQQFKSIHINSRQDQGRIFSIHNRHDTGSTRTGDQSSVSVQSGVGGGAKGKLGNHHTRQDQRRILDVHNQFDTRSRSRTSRAGVSYEGDGMKDNITDWALEQYQVVYHDKSITKEDIFYYTYGVLHHPGFRKKYSVFLVRGIPNIPMAPDFRTFETAGRKLAQLHLNFDTGPKYDLGDPLEPIPDAPRKINFDKKPNPKLHGPKTVDDLSTIFLDGTKVYDMLPQCEYKVNGRTPMQWFADRYKFTTHKESGITNYPLEDRSGKEVKDIMERLVYVGVKSDEIVSGLPTEFEGMEPPNAYDENNHRPALGQQTLDSESTMQTRL